MGPTVVTIMGAEGPQFWGRVKGHLHLLKYASRLSSLPQAQRRRAELDLITLLANVAFEEGFPQALGYASRREYFGKLDSFNPDALRLVLAPNPVLLVIEHDGKTERLDLGQAIGYSAVIPLKEDFYQLYWEGKWAPGRIQKGYIVPREEVPAAPCRVFIEGDFFLPLLRYAQRDFRHCMSVENDPGPQGFFHSYFEHVAHFMPDLRVVGHTVQVNGQGGLPTFVTEVNPEENVGAAEMLLTPFRQKPIPGAQNKYWLDLAEPNDPDTTPERRKSVLQYVRLLMASKQGTRPSRPVIEFCDQLMRTLAPAETRPTPRPGPAGESAPILADLRGLRERFAEQRELKARELQERLDVLAGSSFGSFEANKEVVDAVAAIASENNIALLYDGPKEAYRGRAVNLKCYNKPRSKAGQFYVRLAEAGAALVSGENVFPRLKAVASVPTRHPSEALS
jgi:hypothetical protein